MTHGTVRLNAKGERIELDPLAGQGAGLVLANDNFWADLFIAQNEALAVLNSEFDAMVARMNTPEARATSRAFFSVSGAEMGEAALRAAKTEEFYRAQLKITNPTIGK